MRDFGGTPKMKQEATQERSDDCCEECGAPYATETADGVLLCDPCYAELFAEDEEEGPER